MFTPISLLTLLLVILIPIAEASNDLNGCARSGCHDSSYYQYLTILPDHEKSSIPEDMEEGESFVLAIVLDIESSHSDREYSAFEWTETTLTFDSDSITPDRYVIRTGELLPGTRAFSVSLICHKVEPVMVTIDAVGNNPHEDVRSFDSFTFSINAVIRLSSYTMNPRDRNQVIELVPNEDIDRVEINVSAELEGSTNITPMNLTNLQEAVPSNIAVRLLDPTAQGTIQFTWWAGNRTGTVILTVAIPPGISSGSDGEIFVLVGRVTGVISFVLLIVSTMLCLNLKRWKKFTLRKLGKKRLLLHCYVSYAIVATSLVHLIVLIARGKYSSHFEYGILMTGQNAFFYNLGYFTLLSMILLGLTGIYQKRMMRYFRERDYIPYAAWRFVHVVLTVLASVLVLMHMIMIGTDFKWIG